MFKGIKKKIAATGKKKKAFDWAEKNAQLVGLINAGKVNEAMIVGQELVAYVDRTYRKDAREKATSYNNMGMVFMLARDYILAEECFQEALEMRKRIFGDKHNEIAVILLNLAELYKKQAREILMTNRVETEV